jgi:hypothetical protein
MLNIDEILNKFMLELDLEGGAEELTEAKSDLQERLHKVIIETMINNLDSAQKENFLKIVKENKNLDEEIEKLAASVPGLFGQIADAIDRELALIRHFFGKGN